MLIQVLDFSSSAYEFQTIPPGVILQAEPTCNAWPVYTVAVTYEGKDIVLVRNELFSTRDPVQYRVLSSLEALAHMAHAEDVDAVLPSIKEEQEEQEE